MHINPAYLVIQGLLETQSLNQNGFQLKGGTSPGTSKEGHSYFMLQVPAPLPEGSHEHHLSIFEYLNHQSGGFSHYSIRSVDKVIRIFFDRFGTFFTVQVKAATETPSLPLTQEQEDHYKTTATQTCASIVNQLFKLTEEHFTKERAQASQALLCLENWSKTNSQKTTTFQNKLRRCAALFKKAGLFCLELQERSFLYTRARVLQTYSDNIASEGSKKVELATPTIEVHPVDVEEKNAFPPIDVEQASPEKPKRDLSIINQEFMEVSRILDPVEQLCARYRLLQEKIDNLDDNQFQSIAACFKELDAVQDEAKRELYNCLKRGDEKGFQQLINLGCAPEYDTLFLLVANGNVKLFKQLYQTQKFVLNLGPFPTEFLFKLRDIPLDRIPHPGSGGFLRTAYENDHFAMFEELLHRGCHPDIVHQMSFLFYVIMGLYTKSTQKYAELLIDLRLEDPNVGLIDPESFEVGFRSSQGFVVMIPSKKQSTQKSQEVSPPSEEKQWVASTHKRLLEIVGKCPTTPFLAATYFGYHNLVKKMLETPRVDVNQTDQHGYTALGLSLGLGRPFDGKMVHILLNAGVSIDQYQTPTPKQLFNSCSDAVAKRPMKLTSLFLACFKGDFELVQFLIKKGANVNAFHLFPHPSHTIQGANPEKKAFDISTPFQMAGSCGHEKVLRYLLQTDHVTQKTVDQCLRSLPEERENRVQRNFVLQCIVEERKAHLISDKYKKEREDFCKLFG